MTESDETFWPSFPYSQMYKDYKKLINSIAEKLRKNEVLSIVYQSDLPMWFSEVGPMHEPGYALRVLSQLEGKKTFSPTNLYTLAQIMEDIGRADLNELIKAFEEKHKILQLTHPVEITDINDFQRAQIGRRSFDNPRRIMRSPSDKSPYHMFVNPYQETTLYNSEVHPQTQHSYQNSFEGPTFLQQQQQFHAPQLPQCYTENYFHQLQGTCRVCSPLHPQSHSPHPQSCSPYPQSHSPHPQSYSPYPETTYPPHQTLPTSIPRIDPRRDQLDLDIETDGRPALSTLPAGDTTLSLRTIILSSELLAQQIQLLQQNLQKRKNFSPLLYQSLTSAYFLSQQAKSSLNEALKQSVVGRRQQSCDRSCDSEDSPMFPAERSFSCNESRRISDACYAGGNHKNSIHHERSYSLQGYHSHLGLTLLSGSSNEEDEVALTIKDPSSSWKKHEEMEDSIGGLVPEEKSTLSHCTYTSNGLTKPTLVKKSFTGSTASLNKPKRTLLVKASSKSSENLLDNDKSNKTRTYPWRWRLKK